MRLLLITPPMTQPNTSYPATAHLKGFLEQYEDELSLVVEQVDASLELFLRIFSPEGVAAILGEIEDIIEEQGEEGMPAAVANLWQQGQRYLDTIETVVSFLQGKDSTAAQRICTRRFLPEGPRFEQLGDDDWAFGSLGTGDRAKHLASLYIDDLGDAIREGIDERFEMARYAESLSASAPSFEPLWDSVHDTRSLIDEMLDELTQDILDAHRPDVVGFSVPFPGNVYAAFRMARVAKEREPTTVTVLGGGYANTELRQLEDASVFDLVDYITLDDGEAPLLALLRVLQGHPDASLVRSFHRVDGVLRYEGGEGLCDPSVDELGTPTYVGLELDRYVSLFEMLNPMHRMWSDGRWNKLMVAHGCYWKKCTFCDTSLDYIRRYEPVSSDLLVDRIESLVDETGQTGFHFVDEAAPPARLRALAERLLERGVAITWWGNIRFEKSFDPALVELLAESGCVAISGGLEVASPRLLEMMKKGVSVEQVARVTRAFSDAGILVHAYLMYGFPTQTEQETVDALERVRQLFEAGCIQSAFWHRFAATVHSPIGKQPELYSIRLTPRPDSSFANNDLDFEDPSGVDHDWLGQGLKEALYNYMHGVGLERPVHTWFGATGGRRLEPSRVPANLIAAALSGAA